MNQKLYRNLNDRMIGGVCSGLAVNLKIDVTLVRLFFVLLFFLGGHGLLLYLILWVIMPADPQPDIIPMQNKPQPSMDETH